MPKKEQERAYPEHRKYTKEVTNEKDDEEQKNRKIYLKLLLCRNCNKFEENEIVAKVHLYKAFKKENFNFDKGNLPLKTTHISLSTYAQH